DHPLDADGRKMVLSAAPHHKQHGRDGRLPGARIGPAKNQPRDIFCRASLKPPVEWAASHRVSALDDEPLCGADVVESVADQTASARMADCDRNAEKSHLESGDAPVRRARALRDQIVGYRARPLSHKPTR